MEQNDGLEELRGDERGLSQVGRAWTGWEGSGVRAPLEVMTAGEERAQRGGTLQGLPVRGRTALWANDRFPGWSRNARAVV